MDRELEHVTGDVHEGMVAHPRSNAGARYFALTCSQEQVTKDYMKPYLEATEPMFVKPREFKVLKRVGAPFVACKAQNLEYSP